MNKKLIDKLDKEGSELGYKYDKLCNFLNSDRVKQIPLKHKMLLEEQKVVMREYLRILSIRINLLKHNK